jgi:GR25 family glycosyltransferase involved in LPS biosynthesis
MDRELAELKLTEVVEIDSAEDGTGPTGDSVSQISAIEQKQIIITFVDAISPEDKNFKKDKRKHVNPHFVKRCYCIDKCTHPPRQLRDTEIAICFSHNKVYKKILEQDDRVSMIIEDDIVFHKDFLSILESLFTEDLVNTLHGDNPVIIFCGGKNNPHLSIKDNFKCELSESGIYSNYCYIVNKEACKTLKKYAYPISRPDDSYKRYLIGQNKLQSYVIKPSLIGELSAGVNLPSKYDRFSKQGVRKIKKIK